MKSVRTESSIDSRYTVQIEEYVQEKSLGNNGAEESVMPMRVLHALRDKGVETGVYRF